jgi:PAS domain S-box-containing protein
MSQKRSPLVPEAAGDPGLKEALRASEALYRALCEASPDAILIETLAGQILDCNSAACQLYGYARAELLRLTAFDLVPPEVARGLPAILTEATTTGGRFVEAAVQTQAGLRLAVEMSTRLSGVGGDQRVLVYVRDVTARRDVERALLLSETKYRLLADNTYDWELWIDPAGKVLYSSPSCQRISGYPAVAYEADAALLLRRVHPADRAALTAHRACEIGGQQGEITYRFQHADGREHFLNHVCQPIYGATDEFLGTRVSVRDITELQQALEAGREGERRYRALVEALQESEARYRRLLESVTNYVYTVEVRDGRPVATRHGAGCEALTGYTAEEYAANPLLWLSMVYDEDKPAVTAQAERVLGGDGPRQLEHRIICKNGTLRWVRNTSVPHFDSQGRLVAYEGLLADITDRKLAEATLKDSEARYRTLFEQANDAIFLETTDDQILDVNQRACDLLGYSREQLLALPVTELQAPELRTPGKTAINAELDKFGPQPFETVDLHSSGRRVDVEVTNTLLTSTGRKVIMSIVRDIGDRKRMEAAQQKTRDELERLVEERTAELRAVNRQLRQLTRRVVITQEEERQHLARELHDEAGQVLTGLKLTLEMGQRQPPEGMKASLQQALALGSELIQRVRNLSLDLRPPMLDDLGLLPTLLWHFDRYTAQTKVRVGFEHAGLERRFAPEIETAAYRIVQEALTNVARHARAKQATVRLWVDEDRLNVQVEDRGVGFDREAMLESIRVTGPTFGLTGIRERVSLLDGQLTVDATPGLGTRLTAELPLGGHKEINPDDDFDPIGG